MTATTSIARALPPVYAAAALRLAFPLIVLPVMASRLGADEFGRLGTFLVWAGLLATLVEGGFLAAATRLAVIADRDERWQIARRIFTARCVLSLAATLMAAGVACWIAADQPWAQRAMTAVLLAALSCALGWPATWYLQASGQLHRWARVEIGVYAGWLLAAMLYAHSVVDYLVLNLVAAVLLATLGWSWVRRDLQSPVRQRSPAPPSQAPHARAPDSQAPQSLYAHGELRPGLRLGWTMMPVSIAGAAYSLALPAVASTQMARAELGAYYLADRIVRSLLAAAEPVYQVVYPRIVDRMKAGLRGSLAYAARWAAAGALAGALLLLAAHLGWPLLQSQLESRGVSALRLAPVIAVLGLLLPLLMGWKFFGYWMLGSGRFDHAYRACVVIGGVAGVLGAWRFAGDGAVALAWVAVGVEVVVIVSAVIGMAITRRPPAR